MRHATGASSVGDLRELVAQRGVVLADHRIALLYECRGSGSDTADICAGMTFNQLEASGDHMSLLDVSRLAIDNPRSLSGRDIWRRDASGLSSDLHPIAATILHGAALPEDRTALHLTGHGLNLVDGQYRARRVSGEKSGGAASGIGLRFTRSVSEYLGLDPAMPVPIKVDDIKLLPFRTGVAIAVVELRLVGRAGLDPSLPLLIEAMHLLGDERASRRPALSWMDAADQRFRLSDLLQALVREAGLQVESDRRIYSYVSAVVDGLIDPALKREIAFRLSRRYNYVYDPDVQGKDAILLTPFNNVTHVMSLEGAATLVDRPGTDATKGLPEFLSNWLTVAHGPVYLPIAIIAYHEYLALLELAQEAAVEIDFSKPKAAETDALTELCKDFLAFRLRYRPAQVSRITMHNSFSDHLRLALGNDRLGQKAGQDAAEAERVLAALGREEVERVALERERRWAWYGAFLAGLVAFMAVLGLFEELRTLIGPLAGVEGEVSKVQIVTAEASRGDATFWQLLIGKWLKFVGFGFALFLGLLGGSISWYRLRRGEHEEAESQKELMQQRIERKTKQRQQRSARVLRTDR